MANETRFLVLRIIESEADQVITVYKGVDPDLALQVYDREIRKGHTTHMLVLRGGEIL